MAVSKSNRANLMKKSNIIYKIFSRFAVSAIASLILTASILQILSYAHSANTNDGYWYFIIITMASFVFSNPIWKWMQFKAR